MIYSLRIGIQYLLGVIMLSVPAAAQQKAIVDSALSKQLQSQHFTFSASLVRPLNGEQRSISGDNYSVVVTPDSMDCYLPYFGVAYVAPNYNDDGGLKFVSTNFGYAIKQGKKGVWEINITPRDVRDVTRLDFYISANGNTILNVSRVTAQNISFTGEIKFD